MPTDQQVAEEAPLPATGVDGDPERGNDKGSHRFRRAFVVLGGYLLISLWMWRRLVPHLSSHTLSSGLADPGMFIWWLKWTSWAVTHGHNPLHTSYLDAPAGVSAMWNTSTVSLGLLFTPVTLTFGAVVSFNLACILGPPLSAWTAWMWLRRHVREAPAVIGGLVFGFSPFVVDQSHGGHLNLTWLCLIPIILILLEDLLWRSAHPLWPTAPLLGLVVAIQLLLSSEMLLVLALGCLGVTILLVAADARAAWQRVRIVVPAAAVAIGVALVLSALPLYEQFRSGVVIRKPVQPLGSYGGRPDMLVGATRFLEFHARIAGGHVSSVENGLYLGWPLIALLVVATVLFYRRRGVLVAAAAIVVAADFQMYRTRWSIGGHSFPTPLNLLQTHVRVTGNILPPRFALVMWLSIAWLLAVAIDGAQARVPKRWSLAPIVIAGLCLLPLLPGPAEAGSRLVSTPALFDAANRGAIPNGSIVMIAPMATVGNNAAQLWQVNSDMRFRQVGGYALHAVGSDGTPSYYPSSQTLMTLFGIDLSSHLPYQDEPSPEVLGAARSELRASRATMFIVAPSFSGGERKHLELAQELLGRPPDRLVGDTAIWDLGK